MNTRDKPSAHDYYQSVDAFPADYLARNQHEPERALKVKQASADRRKARQERKRRWAERSGVIRPVFRLNLKGGLNAEDGTPAAS